MLVNGIIKGTLNTLCVVVWLLYRENFFKKTGACVFWAPYF